MKEIKIIPLATAYAGCFLGAGFVSGQELWQFFGEFGVKGYVGLLIACGLLVAFGIVMMRLLQLSGLENVEEVMIPWNVPVLRRLSGVILNVFLLGVVIIMTRRGRRGHGAAFVRAVGFGVGCVRGTVGRGGPAGRFGQDEGVFCPGAHYRHCHPGASR